MFTDSEHANIMNVAKDQIILKEALEALEKNTGIHATYELKDFPYDQRLDAEIEITVNNTILRFVAEVKRELRNYHLRDLPNTLSDLPLIFVADRLYPNAKNELRRLKINYLDTAGNIFIQHNHNYIWIEGNRKTQTQKQTVNRAFTKQGLKVVFLFLWREETVNYPYRKISELSGVALGNIPSVMEGLKETGFLLPLNDKLFTLNKKRALLERWIEGYRDILKPTLHIGNFRAPQPEVFKARLLNGEIENVLLSGESAAEKITQYLSAQTHTIYTKLSKKDFMVQNRLIPDDNGFIQVYERFWNNFPIQNSDTAPELLVYADLVITDEPRCLETAEILYSKRLKYEFEQHN